MNKKTLFNELGSNRVRDRRVFGGNTSNFLDITEVKYNWAIQLWEKMLLNFWHENKYDLTSDVSELKSVNYEVMEYKSFVKIVSGLQYMDSLQLHNLPSLQEQVTAPEIMHVLTGQTFQEAIHVATYSKINKSLLKLEDYDFFLNQWRDNATLKARNVSLTTHLQNYLNDSSNKFKFICAVLTTYCLEGVSFYAGFALIFEMAAHSPFFHQAADAIRAINHDELLHVRIDGYIYKETINELEEDDNITIDRINEFTQKTFYEITEREKEWTEELIYNKTFFTLKKNDLFEYIEYLCDMRLVDIGLSPIYQKTNNLVKPKIFEYISQISGFDLIAEMKHNFFDQDTDQYVKADMITGWNEVLDIDLNDDE